MLLSSLLLSLFLVSLFLQRFLLLIQRLLLFLDLLIFLLGFGFLIEASLEGDFDIILTVVSIFLVGFPPPIDNLHLFLITFSRSNFSKPILILGILFVNIHAPIDIIQLLIGQPIPILLFQRSRKRQLWIFPAETHFTVPESLSDEVLDFSCNRYLVALLFEVTVIEFELVGDESEVELEVGVLKLISVALFVDFIGCLFGVALDHCVEIF